MYCQIIILSLLVPSCCIIYKFCLTIIIFYFPKINAPEINTMPVARAQRSVNGNGSGQIIFGGGPTKLNVNRKIYRMDKNEP